MFGGSSVVDSSITSGGSCMGPLCHAYEAYLGVYVPWVAQQAVRGDQADFGIYQVLKLDNTVEFSWRSCHV